MSSSSIFKMINPYWSITAVKESLRDSCEPQGRRGMNSCILTSTSTPLRSTTLLNDLSLTHDLLAFNVPSPKPKFRTGIPADLIGEDRDSLQSIPEFLEFLLYAVQFPHAQIYQKRGKSLERCSLVLSTSTQHILI